MQGQSTQPVKVRSGHSFFGSRGSVSSMPRAEPFPPRVRLPRYPTAPRPGADGPRRAGTTSPARVPPPRTVSRDPEQQAKAIVADHETAIELEPDLGFYMRDRADQPPLTPFMLASIVLV